VSVDDKLAALRAYRKARGLCFTCGDRWSRDHRCGPSVPLHVVEELLALVQVEEESDLPPEQSDNIPKLEQLMHISQAAAEGSQAATTMRLQGWIQQ
jgi:hypothetical protein